MNPKTKELLKRHNVTIIKANISKDGFAVARKKAIIVSNKLNTIKEEQVILHELGHITHQHKQNKIESPANKIHKENQAEQIRINFDLEEYTKTTPKEYWNYRNIQKHFDIKPEYESYIKEKLKQKGR